MNKYYVIKGKCTTPGEEIFEGYVAEIEETKGKNIISFNTDINYYRVRKYKTRKRCEMMVEKLQEITKNYKYKILEVNL